MHLKHYEHQPHCHPKHDYKADLVKIDKHIRDIIHEGYHQGHIQHMGAGAALHDHVEDLHYGHACKIKKELTRALKLLFMYEQTCHNIYCFFAKDTLMYAERMIDDLHDPEEKEHIRYYADCVEEYMHWLKDQKAEKVGHEGSATTYAPRGAINL